MPGHGPEPRPDEEDQRDRQVRVDADQRGRLGAFGHRTDFHAETGPANEQLQPHHQHQRHDEDRNLLVGDDRPRDLDDAPGQEGRIDERPPAAHQHHDILDHHRHAERRQHRGQARGVAQGAVGDEFHRDAEQADRHKGDQPGQQGEPGMASDAAQDADGRDRHEGAGGKHLAVGEIDQPQHPVDHRVAKRDERVDGADRQRIDDLLEDRRHPDRATSTARICRP